LWVVNRDIICPVYDCTSNTNQSIQPNNLATTQLAITSSSFVNNNNMKIVQLSETAELFKFSYLRNNKSGYVSDESSISEHEESLEWKEDDTCVQLCIPMPGVQAQGIRLSLQNDVLRVWGQRSSSSSSNTNKRQRLNVREFPIDTQMLDIERAIASIWNDTFVLYAPKRAPPCNNLSTSLLEELESRSHTKVASLC